LRETASGGLKGGHAERRWPKAIGAFVTDRNGRYLVPNGRQEST